jgi:hypothetical protein
VNWIMTLRNKSGIVSKVGYTHKSRQDIESISAKWISEGVEVIKIEERG